MNILYHFLQMAADEDNLELILKILPEVKPWMWKELVYDVTLSPSIISSFASTILNNVYLHTTEDIYFPQTPAHTLSLDKLRRRSHNIDALRRMTENTI